MRLRAAILGALLGAVAAVWADDEYESGFLTAPLNRSIARAMEYETPGDGDTLQYGREVTRYASAPQFGGFIVGQYSYSDQAGQHGGDGFNAHYARAYVSGTLLRDFRYRLQMEFRGSPAMRDYFIEWSHWTEFSAKVGQFKVPFTFDSPLNPWDVGLGGYSLATRHLVGYNDYSGAPNTNGRDQGLLFQGNLLPVGTARRCLIHYEAGIFNGNGINRADNNRKKDWIGNIQLRPIDGLRIGLFGWRGTYTQSGIDVRRNRWALGATYEKEGWTARAEYIHHTGHRLSDYDATTRTWSGNAEADGWYALLGVPVTRWFTSFLRYDTYRDDGRWSNRTNAYSLCPNFRLHKNLLFQLQYNHIDDQSATAGDRHYNEFWAQAYIRF
ncbi:MAG: OprO/OprP family phosphate-selective porin [Bacteroidaceae bacterium]|nr:OprO/OprP family phosphate-selective porin [Bacteroidaceae bacterium]